MPDSTSPWISFSSAGGSLLPLPLLPWPWRSTNVASLVASTIQAGQRPLASVTPLPKPCQCPFSQQRREVNGFPGGSPELWTVGLHFLLFLESSASSLAAHFLPLGGDPGQMGFLMCLPPLRNPHPPAASNSLCFLARHASFLNQSP